METSLEEKEKKLELLLARKKYESSLPHLYGFPFYTWARKFFESTNQINLLCSANQISKSSTQIRKCIDWATDQEKWKSLWRTRPQQFWYMYPSVDIAESEVTTKWIPEFLPKDEMKDHPVYGWQKHNKSGYVDYIKFNSGVYVYFKTYSKDEQVLQSSSVHSMFLDEEPPADIVDELMLRLVANDGHFHAVFTATQGQEFWREAIEESGKNRRFKTSFRQQISMYDCLRYEDGSPSPWTEEKIERIKASCKSEAEILRRVYGRFVVDTGLKFPAFSRTKNVIEPIKVPHDYRYFVGVDAGSGGENHPSAVVVVAVSPNFDKAYVVRGRRFDGMVTTNTDLIMLVDQILAEENISPDAIYYDYAAVDLGNMAGQMGKPYVTAEKAHAIGEQIVNVLFKNQMMSCFRIDELEPLYLELCSLKMDTPKRKASDDFCDALRYAVSKIPWDWSKINAQPQATPKPETEIDRRKKRFLVYEEAKYDVDDEISFWEDLANG